MNADGSANSECEVSTENNSSSRGVMEESVSSPKNHHEGSNRGDDNTTPELSIENNIRSQLVEDPKTFLENHNYYENLNQYDSITVDESAFSFENNSHLPQILGDRLLNSSVGNYNEGLDRDGNIATTEFEPSGNSNSYYSHIVEDRVDSSESHLVEGLNSRGGGTATESVSEINSLPRIAAENRVISNGDQFEGFLQIFEAELVPSPNQSGSNQVLSPSDQITSASNMNNREEHAPVNLDEASTASKNAKKDLCHRRIFFIISLLLVLIFTTTTLCLFFLKRHSINIDESGVSSPSSSDAELASAHADSIRYFNALQLMLLSDHSLASLGGSSPQMSAVEWMSFNDSPRLDITTLNRLKQRFALTTMYFSMGGEDWNLKDWLKSGRHECEWDQVSCNADNEITEIELGQIGLSGTLVEDLGLLTSLTSLDFSENRIEGTIPTMLYNISTLVSIIFSRNEISGTIASMINNLSNLEILELNHNYLSGTIPQEFKTLEKLKNLNLMVNGFTGDAFQNIIPSLKNMETIYIDSNPFEGTIPTEIGELSYLKYFGQTATFIGGTLPTEIGNLSRITRFEAHSSSLTGSIPTEIGKLSLLENFHIRFNEMTGSVIPTEIGLCSSLQSLLISHLNIEGSLPTEMGMLTQLRAFFAASNNLEGSIPKEFSNLKNLTLIDFGSNMKMTGNVPIAFCQRMGPSGHLPCSITCDCCSMVEYTKVCLANSGGEKYRMIFEGKLSDP